MAVTAYLYGKALEHAFSKRINWAADTIKVALVGGTYTPNQDAHDYFDDVVAHEVSGPGYTAGGATLSAKTINYNGTTNTLTLDDTNDVVWSNSTLTARYAIIYGSTGTAATSPLIGYIDFGENKVSEAGNFTIVWNANGVLTATVS